MEIRCPSCQAMLALADSTAGKRALCPACETEFRVPDPQPPLSNDAQRVGTAPDPLVRCPACERTLAYDAALAGQAIICPTCGRRLRMPGPGEQVVDLGAAAAGPPPVRRPVQTAPTSPFPGFGENPYASGPVSGTLQPRPAETPPPYAAAGAMLMIFSGVGVLFGGIYLLSLVLAGVILIGVLESLIMLLMVTVAALCHGLAFAGGLQMVLRRNLLLARIGAWAALYPCGMCSVLQVPFAIWALVLLYRSSAPADFSLTFGGFSSRRRDEDRTL